MISGKLPGQARPNSYVFLHDSHIYVREALGTPESNASSRN